MKQRILETSIELFDKNGFTETSVQDIVEAVGVTKGTFYYYFNSKQELLKDIHLGYIEDLVKQQEKIFSDEAKDTNTKLREVIFLLIHNIKNRKESARIFFRERKNLKDDHVEMIKSYRDLFRKNLQAVIEEGVEKGEFSRRLNPDMLTRAILGMTNWSYYWYKADGEVSEEELTDIYTELILHGISTGD
ncbi:TetR/AcrR family transcriptional regulator [Pseudalkalibacillus caeni]|uniref:TetR/AcrR family transcriptional regulator n=1 Tax=Exobacillus caeni TaxID=2574798 RepID=A0A5R9FBB4_9BACL|nr:TetR/AcrR family transcriptional regulator [Pseudalkalibacillus caeni]TLS36915.1 TetR/AcrR family transcriptional regulator [Pseudalkalibacillus caeni]